MGWYKRFLVKRRRSARPVGDRLERVQDDSRQARARNIFAKAGIFLALAAITVAAFRSDEVYESTISIGEVWQREELRAPFDFAILKLEDSLAAERRRVRYTTPPYFSEIPNAQQRMAAHKDTVHQQLSQIFLAYEEYLRNKSRGRLEEAGGDSVRFTDLRRSARLKLTPEQWRVLIDDYVARIPDLPGATREPRPGQPLYEVFLQEAVDHSMQLLTSGVIDIPIDSVFTDEIFVRNQESNTYRTLRKEELYGLNEVYLTVQNSIMARYATQPEAGNITSAFVRAIFGPSLQYLRGPTVRAWQDAENRISSTRGKVSEGDIIVRQDERITPEIKQQLRSLDLARLGRTAPRLQWKRAIGQVLLSLATFVIFFLYLFMVRRPYFDDNGKMLLIALLFAGIIGLFALAVRMEAASVMYAVPVAIVSVLLTVIFDSRVGLFGTLTLALIGGLLLNFDFEFTFATLFGGTLGVFSVRDIKNRGQFFLSAALVFAGYVVVMGSVWLFLDSSVTLLGSDLLMAAINSFFLIIAYPMLWIFERAFDITTDLTLLELSDTNRPLLKELSMRAPGTFNHSLQVANLAEAAAAAIGANALLTRVGALYHDIGKMLKPEYFVENQRPGLNPHDQLKPRMSALIIASHVKEGVEMGRQHKLPQRVLDFIPMHHGTTRIEFFYRKALDDHADGEPPLLETEFRYPGPRPHSKESGILMLSDGVEAASRSLAEPSHKRLDALIDMIIKARIEDGQLDDTELTFRDLKQIKATFLSLLLGIYHIRVKYPGQSDKKKKAAEAEEAPTRQLAPQPEQDAGAEKVSSSGKSKEAASAPGEAPTALLHPSSTDASPTVASGNGLSNPEDAAEHRDRVE